MNSLRYFGPALATRQPTLGPGAALSTDGRASHDPARPISMSDFLPLACFPRSDPGVIRYYPVSFTALEDRRERRERGDVKRT